VNSCDPKIDESGLFPIGDPVGEQTEKQRILAALDRNRWNREKAARELGLSRVTLWRRMSRYDLGSS
jgi:transcriptional regulator of acetoin/glycerol metabolism